MFLVSAWEKINAEAIKILRNPKKMHLQEQKIFLFEKEKQFVTL